MHKLIGPAIGFGIGLITGSGGAVLFYRYAFSWILNPLDKVQIGSEDGKPDARPRFEGEIQR